MCPICTVGVVAGLGISRYLNVDDLIFGLWVGALLISLTFWTVIWLEKKTKNRRAIFLGLSLFFWYGLTIIPLYIKGFIGHPLNRIWLIDKLILGIIVGTIVMIIALKIEKILRKRNNDRVIFPFQKVIIPLFLLLVASLIIHFTK
ncbi:MAG: hypothetical protein NZ822_01715 [Patescibacteria group bacterium]|nr:hypothetical protein [Patescibacteria group bacterium]